MSTSKSPKQELKLAWLGTMTVHCTLDILLGPQRRCSGIQETGMKAPGAMIQPSDQAHDKRVGQVERRVGDAYTYRGETVDWDRTPQPHSWLSSKS